MPVPRCHDRWLEPLRVSSTTGPPGPWARRRPGGVRFRRLFFFSLSRLKISLKFIPDQLLVSLRQGFCRKSVCVLLILNCFPNDRARRPNKHRHSYLLLGYDQQVLSYSGVLFATLFLDTATFTLVRLTSARKHFFKTKKEETMETKHMFHTSTFQFYSGRTTSAS